MIIPIFEYTAYPLFVFSILFSMWAQFRISSSFNKYSRLMTHAGINASDFARTMLLNAGVTDVTIGRVGGNLTDHFNPVNKVLALSDTTYASHSAAAIGVAAHEAGHAIQHAEGYFPIKLRRILVPITSVASRMSWIFITVGIIITASVQAFEFGYYILLAGVGLFAVTTLFQLVTLPCEFNASRRAMAAMENSGYYSDEELSAAKKVLFAAALTYVAATLASAIQLLRLLLILGRNKKRR